MRCTSDTRPAYVYKCRTNVSTVFVLSILSFFVAIIIARCLCLCYQSRRERQQRHILTDVGMEPLVREEAKE